LGGGIGIVLDFKNRVFGLGNLEVNYGIDAHWDIIPGDDFLLGDVRGGNSDVDFGNGLEDGDDDAQAGIEGVGVGTEGEDNASFVLVDDFKAGQNKEEN